MTLDRIHPDLREIYRELVPLPDDPASIIESDRVAFLEQLVNLQLNTALPARAGIHYHKRWIPGPSDNPKLLVGIHCPDEHVGPLPALLWLHGGGKVLGHIDMDADHLQQLALAVGCMIVSVEYRLAPENPYPAGLEDAYAALNWLFQQSGELGVDTSRVAIGGLSGGGGLAAALALLARDRGELNVAFQFLDCPMLDNRLESNSARSTACSPFSSRIRLHQFWQAYLGQHSSQDTFPDYAVPGRADDLSGLPSAYIAVGSLDLFLDENIDYAQKLIRCGVGVEVHVFPDCPHAFDFIAPDAGISRYAMARHVEVLKQVLRG